MNSVLDVDVSFYLNRWTLTHEPQTVNLLEWLNSDEYKEQTKAIRRETFMDRKKDLIGHLPTVIPAGIVQITESNQIVDLSGLVYVDIGSKNSRNVRRLPYVAWMGRNVHGGYGVIVPMFGPLIGDYYIKMLREFNQLGVSVAVDHSGPLRGANATYDPRPYFNHEAVQYTPSRKKVKRLRKVSNDYRWN